MKSRRVNLHVYRLVFIHLNSRVLSILKKSAFLCVNLWFHSLRLRSPHAHLVRLRPPSFAPIRVLSWFLSSQNQRPKSAKSAVPLHSAEATLFHFEHPHPAEMRNHRCPESPGQIQMRHARSRVGRRPTAARIEARPAQGIVAMPRATVSLREARGHFERSAPGSATSR